MSDTKPPTFKFTGRVLKGLCMDLEWVRGQMAFRASCQRLPVYSGPIYRPPGIWYEEAPAGPGHPLLFRFPPPYHPLECFAAINGMGGYEPPREPHETVEQMRMKWMASNARGNSWADHTVAIAKFTGKTVGVIRLAFHLLTPLHTNHLEDEDKLLGEARGDLFESAGFSRLEAAECFRNRFKTLGTLGTPVPVKYGFWGESVAGEIEL